MKLQILKDIVKTYGLIDGQKISGKLLKQIATEKSLSIEEVIALLGISNGAKYRLQKSEKTKMIVNLKQEIEREKIREQIKNAVFHKNHFGIEDLMELERQSKMVCGLFLPNIGIKANQYYKMRCSNKYVCKKQKEYVLNERDLEIRKCAQYKESITKREIEKIKRIFGITDKQMILILNVRTRNYRNVMNGKTKRLKIDLLSREEKIEILKKIKEYKSEGKVTAISLTV